MNNPTFNSPGHDFDRPVHQTIELTGSNSVNIRKVCDPSGQKMANHSSHQSPNSTGVADRDSLENSLFPVTVKLEFGGWWGRNNAIVKDGRLADLKRRCVSTFAEGFSNDAQNRTPHVNLGGDPKLMARMEGRVFELRPNHIRRHDNYLDIDVGLRKHFTLVYRSGLNSTPDLQAKLDQILREWVLASSDTKSSPTISESSITSSTNLCVVCMVGPIDCLIDCPHYCLCFTCASKLNECPLCRCSITYRLLKTKIVFA